MGDRYELSNLKCSYCKFHQEESQYYAPTCGFLTFKCEKCKRYNFITTDLEVKKIGDVTYDDVYLAINNASNMMDEKMIESMAKDVFENLNKPIEAK